MTQNTDEELHKLFLYFMLFYLIFDALCTAKIARKMSRDIVRGTLNSFLVKPIDYPLTLWIEQTCKVLARIIIPIILFIILGFVRPDIFSPASFLSFIVFFITGITGVILWNVFITLIGTLAFWVQEVSQLQNAINLVLNIFIGRYIPVYLFSQSLRDLLSLTPANFFGNFQILIYQGQLPREEILKGVIVMLVWIIILSFLTKTLYNKGLRAYEASGN